MAAHPIGGAEDAALRDFRTWSDGFIARVRVGVRVARFVTDYRLLVCPDCGAGWVYLPIIAGLPRCPACLDAAPAL